MGQLECDFLRYIVRDMCELCTVNSHFEALNQEETQLRFSFSVDAFVANLFKKK